MAENTRKRIGKGNDKTAVLETGKLQPQAIDLEEAVLGALMLEKNAITIVADILKPESFYKEQHILIFQVIKDLFSSAEPIDILTVTAELRKEVNLKLLEAPTTLLH